MQTRYSDYPFVSSGDIRLDGQCGEKDRATLEDYFLRLTEGHRGDTQKWRPEDRHVVRVEIPEPSNDTSSYEQFSKVEALMNGVAAAYGWSWRVSDCDDDLDRMVVEAEAIALSAALQDMGTKARREHEEAQKGWCSVYFTGSPHKR